MVRGSMTELRHFETMLANANLGVIKSLQVNSRGTIYKLQNSGPVGAPHAFSTWIFDPNGALVSVEHWNGK